MKKIKRKTFLAYSILLIFFLSLFMYFKYLELFSEKISQNALSLYERNLYNVLSKNIVNSLQYNYKTDILDVEKNSNGDILYVDYNLQEVYALLNNLSKAFKKDLIYDTYIYKIPFLSTSNNVFYNNIGPKVVIRINYIDGFLTNVKTKVTDYGLNNALIEVYLNVKIICKILSPGIENEKNFEYDFLIASKVINGKVPSFYGGSILSSSALINIPINV